MTTVIEPTITELEEQLAELQNRVAELTELRKQRVIEWDRSGDVDHVKFFKDATKAIGYNVSVEHERDDEIDADLYWVNDQLCVIDYKGKWIVDYDGFDSDLDTTLADPRNEYKIHDTRVDAVFGLNHLLADDKVFVFEEKLYNQFDL